MNSDETDKRINEFAARVLSGKHVYVEVSEHPVVRDAEEGTFRDMDLSSLDEGTVAILDGQCERFGLSRKEFITEAVIRIALDVPFQKCEPIASPKNEQG